VGDHDYYDLKNCYATGNVFAKETGGGLVGFSTAAAVNCYATGDVNCTRVAGGLIGEDGYGGAINCYSIGHVTGSQEAGGLVGRTYHSEAIVGCFWDVNTSGQTTGAGGTGLTTVQMMQQASFTGWDFSAGDSDPADWMMLRPTEDYPRLAWQEIFEGDIAGLYGVDWIDLEELAFHWLQTGCPTDCEDADIDESGTVDLLDYSVLAADWLVGM
jgi:hypothetical protein